MHNTPTQLHLPLTNETLVKTLKGEIPLSTLGKVLVHEHIFCRVRPQYLPVVKAHLLRQFDVLVHHGVNTIIDLTTYVLPDHFLDILENHQINIVCCAGYYLKGRVPKTYHNLDAEGLSEKLLYKVEFGIGKRKIKPGILKVASSGRELTKFEKNAFRAVAFVHKKCNLPIVTHAPRGARRQVEILLHEGVSPHQILISHMEMEMKGTKPLSFEEVLEDMLWILSHGVSIFFGDFTVQNTAYRKYVLKLITTCYKRGYAKQIFLSTDSYWTYRSGHLAFRGTANTAKIPRDYSYVFNLIVPLLLDSGFSPNDIELFLKQNPSRLFSPSVSKFS